MLLQKGRSKCYAHPPLCQKTKLVTNKKAARPDFSKEIPVEMPRARQAN